MFSKYIRKMSGFTLMELVVILVVLAILAASAIPKYVDLKAQAQDAAKDGMIGVVRSAFAISIADLKRAPTVTELATYVQGEGVAATDTGVLVTISGLTNPVVRTYTDSSCTTATTAVGDTVQCVGTIA